MQDLRSTVGIPQSILPASPVACRQGVIADLPRSIGLSFTHQEHTVWNRQGAPRGAIAGSGGIVCQLPWNITTACSEGYETVHLSLRGVTSPRILHAPPSCPEKDRSRSLHVPQGCSDTVGKKRRFRRLLPAGALSRSQNSKRRRSTAGSDLCQEQPITVGL
jgi:hypothetical protein